MEAWEGSDEDLSVSELINRMREKTPPKQKASTQEEQRQYLMEKVHGTLKQTDSNHLRSLSKRSKTKKMHSRTLKRSTRKASNKDTSLRDGSDSESLASDSEDCAMRPGSTRQLPSPELSNEERSSRDGTDNDSLASDSDDCTLRSKGIKRRKRLVPTGDRLVQSSRRPRIVLRLPSPNAVNSALGEASSNSRNMRKARSKARRSDPGPRARLTHDSTENNERRREMSLKERISNTPGRGESTITFEEYLKRTAERRARRQQLHSLMGLNVSPGAHEDRQRRRTLKRAKRKDKMSKQEHTVLRQIVEDLVQCQGGKILLKIDENTKNLSGESFGAFAGPACLSFNAVVSKHRKNDYSSREAFLNDLIDSLCTSIEFFKGNQSTCQRLLATTNLVLRKLAAAFTGDYVRGFLKNCALRRFELSFMGNLSTPSGYTLQQKQTPEKQKGPVEVIDLIDSSDEDGGNNPLAKQQGSAALQPPTEIFVQSDDEEDSSDVCVIQTTVSPSNLDSPISSRPPDGKTVALDESASDSDIEVVDAREAKLTLTSLGQPETKGDVFKPIKKAGDANGDLEVVGVRNEISYPHARFHCTADDFETSKDKMKTCTLCYCFICDIPSSSCREWRFHCQAIDKGKDKQKWKNLRERRRQELRLWQTLYGARREYPPQYQQWPLPLIKQECKARQMKRLNGKKAELIDFLIKCDNLKQKA